MDAKKMGKFIMEVRKEQNMTQAQLAEKLHVTDKAVSRWERGTGYPDVTSIEPLADALGVSIVEIMKGERLESEHVEEDDVKVAFKNLISILGKEKYRKRWISAMVVLAIVVVSVFGFLQMKEQGVLGVLENGIHRMHSDQENFPVRNYSIVAGTWSVEIDLSDLESNEGKVLFEEDGHKIVVNKLYKDNLSYCIQFRSYGKYDLHKGSLYSAHLWEIDEDGSYSEKTITLPIVSCDGISYEMSQRGYGAHPKDGAIIDYYIWPDYFDGDIPYPEEVADVVTITFDKLIYQEWSRYTK